MSKLDTVKRKAKREGWAKWIRSEADERAAMDGYTFDIAAGEHIVKFFERFLRHTMGRFSGDPFKLLGWQRDDILMPLFGWKRPDGKRRYSKGDIFVAKKQGKALAVDTPVPTPRGWTTMGDLSPGDQVYDENGNPCNIIAATDVQLGRPCYRVEFTYGESIVADAEHEWLVHPRYRKACVMTTAEMAGNTRIESKGSEGCRYAMNVAGPLTGVHDDCLPIPPYTLGAWLGDGHSSGARLTSGYEDPGVVAAIRDEGIAAEEHPSPNTGSALFSLEIPGTYRTPSSLWVRLKKRGLTGTGNKHIPTRYFEASHAQRLSLMQGLMDTDGTANVGGQCEYTSISKRLALDVLRLATSLGYKPSMNEGRATLNGKDCGPKYRVQFYAFSDESCFMLSRKAARLKSRPHKTPRCRRRHISQISPVPSVPVRCIQVDSDSQLFLAGRSCVPTHNSTLAAGLANYFLVASGDRAEVYGVAHTRDQAGIIYREAAAMARTSPELSKLLKVRDSQKRILYPGTMSFYQALAGENNSRGVEGINPVLVLFDEIHVQRSRELYDGLAYASAARPNSLMLSVSTVGVADETTIWWEQYEYAKGIIAGTITDHSRFAYVAQADDACLHSAKLRSDPKQWAKAMPSLGVTVATDKVKEAVREAENSPAKLNNLLRYLFNIPTAQVSRVVPMEQWGRCVGDEPELAGKRCFGGLDVASTRDLTAFVLYFPKQPGLDRAYLKAWHWCPEATIRKHVLAGRQYYQKWVDDGWLIETHGDTLDHDEVRADIEQAFQDYTIEEVGFDPTNADAISNPLFNTGYPLVKIMQTHAGMSPGTTALLADIESEKVSHGGDAVLTWCFSNCAGDARGEEVKFVKDADAAKIDGAVAAAMARGRSMASAAEGNIYDTRGIVQI